MKFLLMSGLAAFSLTGCMTAVKTTGAVASLPFKAGYQTTKLAGKGVVGTTKFVGKSTIATGKGVYYVGSVPVKITDKALDSSIKVLTITTMAVDLTGNVVTVSRNIQAAQLDNELRQIQTATNILSVTVDAFS